VHTNICILLYTLYFIDQYFKFFLNYDNEMNTCNHLKITELYIYVNCDSDVNIYYHLDIMELNKTQK
jgi:hypothetical protein